MQLNEETWTIAADSEKTGRAFRGHLAAIQYTADTFDAGANLVVSILQPGEDLHSTVVLTILLNGNETWRPRTPVHNATGAVIAGIVTHYELVDARLKLAITGGGAAVNQGFFRVTFER